MSNNPRRPVPPPSRRRYYRLPEVLFWLLTVGVIAVAVFFYLSAR